MKQNRLTLIALIMLLIGIALSSFTLWYAVVNRKAFETSLQNNLRNELAKFNIQPPAEASVDDKKILLAVAKYCEANGNCKGYNGNDGANGKDGVGRDGADGRDGRDGYNGYTPIKGVDYNDGQDGATPACMNTEAQCQGRDGVAGTDGQNGREIERQCNAEKRRMEWRLVGEANWQVEYKLAPGQECEIL